MEIKADEIWSVFKGTESFESFQKNTLESMHLKIAMPKDIQEEIKIVEKLLLHSYFEYSFIDIALTQSIFTFEKALRLKWTEINLKPTKLSLEKLIDWAFENNFLETNNEGLPHQLRYIRNGKAHDEKKSNGGIAFLKKVYNTIDLINDLYEDVSLRLQRKKSIANISTVMNGFFMNGVIQNFKGERLIIYNAFPVFVNNKVTPNILHLSVCPIFNLEPYANGKHYQIQHLTYCLTNWSFENGLFTAIEVDTGEEFIFSKIEDETNELKFKTWHSEFFNLPDCSLVMYLAFEPLNDYFISSLRKFHSIE